MEHLAKDGWVSVETLSKVVLYARRAKHSAEPAIVIAIDAPPANAIDLVKTRMARFTGATTEFPLGGQVDLSRAMVGWLQPWVGDDNVFSEAELGWVMDQFCEKLAIETTVPLAEIA